MGHGRQDFQVRLAYENGSPVPSDLVPITYSYDGSGGYTIRYPNSDDYYNDYFGLNYPYTIKIYPTDPPTRGPTWVEQL